MKSLDILVLLALLREERGAWTYRTLSSRLATSTSEVYRSLQRAAAAHLFDRASGRVRTAELLEFIAHGSRYAFAVEPGRTARGTATAWDGPGLEGEITRDDLDRFVWPNPKGSARGRAVEPLHAAALTLAENDERLYRQLALCDCVRLGGARERELAARLLGEELRSR